MPDLKLSLTGSLAFCAILVLAGAYSSNAWLWGSGTLLGAFAVFVEIAIRIGNYQNHGY